MAEISAVEKLWLKCWSAPLENAVMKNKRRGSAKMPAIRLRVNHDFPMYVLDFFNSPIKKSPFPEWT